MLSRNLSEVYKKETIIVSNLYNRIEELCAKHNESITSMCKESGASRASLSDLKVGRKQSLSAETLSKIAAHFGVSVDYLLGIEESDWSFAFRQNMLGAMSNYDSFDYAEAGVDENWLYAVASGDTPLTFKTACDVADILGESFDSLLGRDYINQSEETEKAPTDSGERLVSDDDIKFALFGGDGEITDEMYERVKKFAAFIKQEEAEKKKE